jgi:hypothetical protein
VTRTRTGLLIIRAWVESGSSSPLRAQIRLTSDVSLGLERSQTVTQADAVVQAVQAWLLEMTTDFRAFGADADGPEQSR